MSYNVLSSLRFEKEAKRLLRKYPSFKNDLDELIGQLIEDPLIGTPLGNDCFKIRLAIKSKGKGKSGGARVITYIYFTENTVVLLSVYDKSEKSSISEKEIIEMIRDLND